jgi:phosphoglycolate phosphatase
LSGEAVIALLNFDYDGVLADSLEDLLGKACEAQRRTGEGRQPAKEDFETISNLTFIDLARHIGIPEERVCDFQSKLFELLEENSGDVRLFGGVAEVVRKLAEEHILVVISSNLKEAVERVLRQNGLAESFSLILDARSAGSKSDKIALAQRRFGRGSDDTFMIGDVVSDIREGKIAGVKTVAVTWGYQSREVLLGESPDYVADSPDDLLVIAGRGR